MPYDREYAHEASLTPPIMTNVLLDIWNRLDALEQWSETQPCKQTFYDAPRCQNTSHGYQCDDKKAGHDGVHWHRDGFNIIVWTAPKPTPIPKWRQLVDEYSGYADDPLAAVLYNMYAIYLRPRRFDCLARIVAVCEQQVPGFTAEPYNSDGFSPYRLVSAFGCSLDHMQPDDSDWKALGNVAASWLKHLTETDDE